mmetsp:Transcript_14840/g.36990  ORF Transcript_14840/g.36990 Transcript_14840/m.36990 type:complete len:283 (+) Transcript_14840:485-1333(+)
MSSRTASLAATASAFSFAPTPFPFISGVSIRASRTLNSCGGLQADVFATTVIVSPSYTSTTRQRCTLGTNFAVLSTVAFFSCGSSTSSRKQKHLRRQEEDFCSWAAGAGFFALPLGLVPGGGGGGDVAPLLPFLALAVARAPTSSSHSPCTTLRAIAHTKVFFSNGSPRTCPALFRRIRPALPAPGLPFSASFAFSVLTASRSSASCSLSKSPGAFKRSWKTRMRTGVQSSSASDADEAPAAPSSTSLALASSSCSFTCSARVAVGIFDRRFALAPSGSVRS